MKRALLLAVALSSMLLGAATIPAAADLDPGRASFRLIEDATTDTVVDIGAPGDSTGDLLTFHNRVRWSDGRRAGVDQGSCVRIDPAAGTWECAFTIWVKNGAHVGRIAVAGSFYDAGVSPLAVTGGTGDFKHASGTLWIRTRDASSFWFTFAITL
jgi:allene oxide cyclase